MKTVIIDGVEYTPVEKQEEVRKPRDWTVMGTFLCGQDGLPGLDCVAVIYDNAKHKIGPGEMLHLLETLPGSIRVSKEHLRRSFYKSMPFTICETFDAYFDEFCKALGFPE